MLEKKKHSYNNAVGNVTLTDLKELGLPVELLLETNRAYFFSLKPRHYYMRIPLTHT